MAVAAALPGDDAVMKHLYLASNRLEMRWAKWNRSVRSWQVVLGQFAVFFEERLPDQPTPAA